MIWLLSIGFSSAVVSYGVIRLVLSGAAETLVDVPNERSSHESPTPRGGGLGIVAVTAIGGLAYGWQTGQWGLIGPLLAGGLPVAFISLLDDVRSVPNRYRIAVHLGAAAIAMLWIGTWQEIDLPGLGRFSLGLAGPILTLLWIVGLINAYNFMDGIDGLAGGQAVVAGLALTWLGSLVGRGDVATMAATITGGAAGFLLLNWAPARIFLGDVGSAFLGYCFAVLPLAAAGSDGRGPIVAALFVGPFVFDSSLTFVRRALSGENVFLPHRRHLYQRMVDSRMRQPIVTGLYLALAMSLAALGGAAWLFPGADVGAAPIAASALCLALWAYARHVEQRTYAAPEPLRSS